VVVDTVLLERGVAEVAPQDREHAHLMGLGEGLGDLVDLTVRLLRPEVHGGADGDRAQLERLASGPEGDLVVGARVVEEVVVVELRDERDAVHVAPRHGSQDAESGRDRAALPCQGELAEVRRVEVQGVLGEAGGRGVLDALVDREDGEVPGATEATVAVERAQRPQHRRGAVGVSERPVEEVRTWQHQPLRREGLRLVAQERAGFVAEQLVKVRRHAQSLPPDAPGTT
jgi:hypothetical protein